MEKLLENECFKILEIQLQTIKEINTRFQKTIDKEIENIIASSEIKQTIEETLQKKTESIEKMKELVKEMSECSKQLNESIQKEEFNAFVMKKKYDELIEQQKQGNQLIIDNENEYKHLNSRKRMYVNEEFGEEEIVTDEDFLFEKKMSKENEIQQINEKKLKENQLQNEIIEKAFPKLQEWSGKNEVEMIFDSDIDYNENKITIDFNETIEDLFIFIFEEKGNVFGWYLPNGIEDSSSLMECWLINNGNEQYQLIPLQERKCIYSKEKRSFAIITTSNEPESIIYFALNKSNQSLFKQS